MNATATDPLAKLRSWEPIKTPAYYRDLNGALHSTEEVAQAVYRSDSGEALGVIGARADVVLNKPKCDLFDELKAKKILSDLSCDEFDGGQIVYLQGRSNEGQAEIRPGHEIQHRLTLVDGYVGKVSLSMCDFMHNIFCKNQLEAIAQAAAKNGHRIRHTSKVNLRFDEIVRQIMASAEQFRYNIQALKHLDSQTATFANMRTMLDKFLPLPEPEATERTRNRVQNIRDRVFWAYEHAPAAVPGTRYGMLQAITYYCTHERGSDRTRAKANMLGGGARLGQQAFQYLLN